MTPRNIHALIAATDEETIVSVAHAVLTRLDARIHVVSSFAEARRSIEKEMCDVVLAERSIEYQPAWLLADQTGKRAGPPLILIGDDWDTKAVLEALRHGAADVLDLPLDQGLLSRSVCKVVHRHRARQRVVTRNRRLRALSSRLVRDRRELRGRVDLICRDLVQAYRQLAEKVVAGKPASTTCSGDLDVCVPDDSQ